MAHEAPCRRSLVRIEGQNHARSLTFSCFHNHAFLRSQRSCQWLVDALIQARLRHGFHLWAWVAMPTHVHLLIYPPNEQCRIGPILSSIKQSVTKRAIAWTRQHAPEGLHVMVDATPTGHVAFRFWQRGGGYDRNIFTPEAVRSEIAYIHANPVRGGLCARLEDWEWSSAREHLRPGAGPISIDLEHLRTSLA